MSKCYTQTNKVSPHIHCTQYPSLKITLDIEQGRIVQGVLNFLTFERKKWKSVFVGWLVPPIYVIIRATAKSLRFAAIFRAKAELLLTYFDIGPVRTSSTIDRCLTNWASRLALYSSIPAPRNKNQWKTFLLTFCDSCDSSSFNFRWAVASNSSPQAVLNSSVRSSTLSDAWWQLSIKFWPDDSTDSIFPSWFVSSFSNARCRFWRRWTDTKLEPRSPEVASCSCSRTQAISISMS